MLMLMLFPSLVTVNNQDGHCHRLATRSRGWRFLAIAGNVSEVRSKASVRLFETLVARLDTQLLLYVKFLPLVVDPVVLVTERPYRAACSGPMAAMVGFWVFWQVARSSPKEIKFQQSYAHTCAQGIICYSVQYKKFNCEVFNQKCR
jgi:hypothetical protein